MKRHLITVFLLVAALALYAIGAAGLGTVFLILGGIMELMFWLRIFKRDKSH